MYEEVVVTLYEGHYHYGVAALINSLHAHKFSGLVLVGYRGGKPDWAKHFEKVDESICQIGQLRVQFKAINTPLHFGYYKPYLLQEVMILNEQVKKVYYFDPDIVINTDWNFYESWVDCGVALCLDANYAYLHHNHPWRNEWKTLFVSVNNNFNPVDWYVNSGFIGLSRKHLLILQRWIGITEKYKVADKNIKSFDQHISQSAFKGDQDLLNAAITITPELEYSVIGKEGMGFEEPAYVMYHAVGDAHKPWKKKYIKTLLQRGVKPTMAETAYFSYVTSPIQTYSKLKLYFKKIDLKIAKILGRIIG